MRSNWQTPVVTRPRVVIENVARRSSDWPWQRTLEALPAIKRAGSDIILTYFDGCVCDACASAGAVPSRVARYGIPRNCRTEPLPSNRGTHRNFDTTVS